MTSPTRQLYPVEGGPEDGGAWDSAGDRVVVALAANGRRYTYELEGGRYVYKGEDGGDD